MASSQLLLGLEICHSKHVLKKVIILLVGFSEVAGVEVLENASIGVEGAAGVDIGVETALRLAGAVLIYLSENSKGDIGTEFLLFELEITVKASESTLSLFKALSST